MKRLYDDAKIERKNDANSISLIIINCKVLFVPTKAQMKGAERNAK